MDTLVLVKFLYFPKKSLQKITKARFDCTLILSLTPRLVDPIVVTLFVKKDEIVALPFFGSNQIKGILDLWLMPSGGQNLK